MPILYHFIAENVNDKSGKYSIYLCTFSVHNAQLFFLQILYPYFY